jgi:integrase
MSTSSSIRTAAVTASTPPPALATTIPGGAPRRQARARQDQPHPTAWPKEDNIMSTAKTPAAPARTARASRPRKRTEEPRPPRGRGDDGIHWDKANRCYVGTISLGHDPSGKRLRRTVRGSTTTEVKNKLGELHDELKVGVRTPATYTIEQCVRDWLGSLTLDPVTAATYCGQAEKWIYPMIGKARLKDFKATDADRFFADLGKSLSKRSLLMIRSTLRRSIRRAQRHDLISRNVAELADLPEGQPGRPSRAMTQEQAGRLLATAGGVRTRYTEVVVVGQYKHAAAHAATSEGILACGTKPRKGAPITPLGSDLTQTTCRYCRSKTSMDGESDLVRLEALVVLAITLGLRPGELRALRWDHLDLKAGIIHVWRSARRGGDTKTPQSRRTLQLPQRAVSALSAHRRRQAIERLAAGFAWHDHGLVFCHEDGTPYDRDALNWRFSKLTREAGLGHWHAHEARHTAVSIMSSNGVPIQDIADTVGHKSTTVTQAVYRHVIVPAVKGGAAVMDDVFGHEAQSPSPLSLG